MKKFYVIAAMALASLTASAQQTLTLSTYLGTNIAKYEGMTKNVTINRQMFKGWNTICLPVSMSAAEVCEAFGNDCRLEKLVGVESVGNDIKLNFQDCMKEGIMANRPYILYFNKENQSVRITLKDALIKNQVPSVSFNAGNGTVVTFSGTNSQMEATGLYGILAKDNAEASFVNVDTATNGFYATRCFIELSTGNMATLSVNHIGEGEVTAISSVVKAGERADVYNVSGVKIAEKASISEINSLEKGVYVVKGKKIAVK